jgi:hypothetical protein
MMKMIIVLLIVSLFIALLVACVPDDPSEIPQYCKDVYAANPGYPPGFVGACISYLESDHRGGLPALCNSETMLAEMEFETKQECIKYMAHFSE